MSKLRVHCFAISLDGYGAGPDQNRENPLGVGGVALHEWVFPTRTFQEIFGKSGGKCTSLVLTAKFTRMPRLF